TGMAAYLFIWGLFTAVMFIGTSRLNVALQVIFGSLAILFFLRAIGDFVKAGPISDISPATKEFSVDYPRSTPASSRSSTKPAASHPAAWFRDEVAIILVHESANRREIEMFFLHRLV